MKIIGLRWVWPLSVVAAVCLLGGWLIAAFGPIRASQRRPTTVVRTVPPETVYAQQPARQPSIVHRVLWRSVPAETVLVSLPGAVDTLVQQFCPAPADSAAPPALPPPQLVLTAGRVASNTLAQWGFTNRGVAWSGTFAVRHRGPPIEWRTDGDSLRVWQRRQVALWPDYRELRWAGVGLLAGAVLCGAFCP